MSDVRSPPSGQLGAAVLGGLVGALLTTAILIFAVPQLAGSRLVRAGIMADPQVLVDGSEALRDRQYAPIVARHRAEIETPFGTSWKGASKPDVVLVEFYDYACPYCKASNPALEQLIKEYPGLRVVYRELPILGPQSVTAARQSLAASKAGRFVQFHDTLWEAGRPAPQSIAMASQAAGVAPKAADSADIEAELKKNFQLASALGATGTPLFVVGDRVFNSAVGYETLKTAIEEARDKS